MKPETTPPVPDFVNDEEPSVLTARAQRLYNRFRDLLRCEQYAVYLNPYTQTRLCIACCLTYEPRNGNYKYIEVHDAALDIPHPSPCFRCGKETTRTRPVLQCPVCVAHLNELVEPAPRAPTQPRNATL